MRIKIEVPGEEADRIIRKELRRIKRDYPKGCPMWVAAKVLLEYYS